MKITIEKKLQGDGSFIKTEELHIEIPEEIVDELAWDDGTVVEWETQDDGKVVLRNIDGLELD
jgi:hypothetical protein|tara:strand:- start:214 stop:402 length:189 start_codon:yes stop_codon:yes gene_type:complete